LRGAHSWPEGALLVAKPALRRIPHCSIVKPVAFASRPDK